MTANGVLRAVSSLYWSDFSDFGMTLTGLWVKVASGTGICSGSCRPILGRGPATSVPVLMDSSLGCEFGKFRVVIETETGLTEDWKGKVRS